MSANATTQDVSRLLGRAAFGARAEDLAAWEGKPYASMVDALIAGPAQRSTDLASDARRPTYQFAPQQTADAQGWWLERMRTAEHPLQERLTLLWHDHFATGVTTAFNGRPDLRHVMTQNQTLRSGALGDFRELLAAMNIDPAMLFWLNGAQSAPPKPNENYGREFLELFSLGVRPQVFSEGDIRAVARSFTGWTVLDPPGVARFDANRHDKAQKTVLGVKIGDLGEAEHRELVRIVCDQPVAARFIASKLVSGLAYDLSDTDLLASPDPLVVAVADELRRTNWNVAAALRVLFLSDAFRNDSVARRRVRSPIEVAVHLAKALGIGLADAGVLEALGRMGQKPFVPPNVGGWPGGISWFSPATTIARYDLALVLARIWQNAPPTKPAVPASSDVAGWARKFGLPSLQPETDQALRSYLAERSTAPEAEKVAGVVAILAVSPDWTIL